MKKLIRLLLAAWCFVFSAYTMAENMVTITIKTSLGDIELSLNSTKAPKTVANFVRYAQEDFYDNTIFHRVINGFMIQGGGFDENMVKKEVHDAINNEAYNGLRNDRGSIAMARTGDPHSATAQFFINLVDNDRLNFSAKNRTGWGYAVFGKVTKGMNVVDAISEVLTSTQKGRGNVPDKPVLILDVTVDTPINKVKTTLQNTLPSAMPTKEISVISHSDIKVIPSDTTNIKITNTK